MRPNGRLRPNGGVLAIELIGAIIAPFQPDGMARTLFTTALAQALVAVITLKAGWGSAIDILDLAGFFAALWQISARLFRKAAREQISAGAAPQVDPRHSLVRP